MHVWACLICIFLAGCGIAQQAKINQEIATATATRDQAIAACQSKYADRHSKPSAPRVACLNDADMAYNHAMARSSGNPYLDLVRLSHARRLQAAQRYDKGQIDAAQFDVELATISAETNNQIVNRQNSAAMAAAAQQQAAAASQQAAAATQQTINSAIQAATPPRPVSCTRYGNTVTCN